MTGYDPTCRLVHGAPGEGNHGVGFEPVGMERMKYYDWAFGIHNLKNHKDEGVERIRRVVTKPVYVSQTQALNKLLNIILHRTYQNSL